MATDRLQELEKTFSFCLLEVSVGIFQSTLAHRIWFGSEQEETCAFDLKTVRI